MPEHLTEPDAQAARQPLAAAPAMQRMALGLLVVVLGGVLLSQTVLGIAVLATGAWLTSGRGLPELRRGIVENSAYLLHCFLSGAVFCAALWQAWTALLPTLPLFAISVLLLPPASAHAPATGLPRLSPIVRELAIVILLGVYGRLLAQDWSEKSAALLQTMVRTAHPLEAFSGSSGPLPPNR